MEPCTSAGVLMADHPLPWPRVESPRPHGLLAVADLGYQFDRTPAHLIRLCMGKHRSKPGQTSSATIDDRPEFANRTRG